MADERPITLREGNDEVLKLTITRDDPTDDLLGVETLQLFLKPDVCAGDTDLGVLQLSSTDPTQITLDAQTSAQILATAYIPRSALSGAYSRFWRVDGLGSGGVPRRTAMYGPVKVVNL